MQTVGCVVAIILSFWIGAGAHASFAGAADAALEGLDAVALDGTRVTPHAFRGRVVLLDFWATWCAPCLAELPRLKTLHSRYPRTDFEIVGVNLDAGHRRALTSWLNRNRIDWPQIHEPRGYEGHAPRLFRVDRLPMTVLVNRDGSVDAVGLRGEPLSRRVAALVARSPQERTR